MKVHINGSRAAAYILLPGLIPRVQELSRAPFAFLAALFAQLFDIAKLLPKNHPYTYPQQYGTFGMLDVLRAGSAHLKFDIKHIDQVIIFFAVLAGWVTFLLFLVVGGFYLALTPTLAAPMPESTSGLMASIYQYTATPNPTEDLALGLLDRTLGIKGDTSSGSFFGSGVPFMCPGMGSGAKACLSPPPFPSAFHTATHQLLAFYSWAIFAFSVLYLLYLVATIVMDVAKTGKPVGEHINSFWTPIRLVIAIGMLVPLAPHNLNAAQYIVLYTGKVSSAFATNGWLYYNQILERTMSSSPNPIGIEKTDSATNQSLSPLAAKLGAPNLSDLVKFMHLIVACEYYYETYKGKQVQGYFVLPGKPALPAYSEPSKAPNGAPGAGYTYNSSVDPFVPYEDAVAYFKNGNIRLTFGFLDPIQNSDQSGFVRPVCGEIIIPVTSKDDPSTEKIENPGSSATNKLYYQYILALLDKTTYPRQLMDGFASQMIEHHSKTGPYQDKTDGPCQWDTDNNNILNHPLTGNNLSELETCSQDPPRRYIQYQIEMFQGVFQALVNAGYHELANPENFSISEKVLKKGWAAAGVWYQHIASANGNFVTTVGQTPYGSRMPAAIENYRILERASRAGTADRDALFKIATGQMNLDPIKGENDQEKGLRESLVYIEKHLNADQCSFGFIPNAAGTTGVSGQNGFPINEARCDSPNFLMVLMTMITGMQFVFRFDDNLGTHPLAQLVTLGRTLLEVAGNKIMTGSGIAAAGGLTSIGNKDAGGNLGNLANAYLAIAGVIFSAGFMLFYVLPLLPFIYFFFAMLSWVKAIFEGLIGAPLWAAAHLRIESKGFPSDLSINGYLLLLEIFLRPIITIFALVGAMAVFAGMMSPIHDFMAQILLEDDRYQLAGLVSGIISSSSLFDQLQKFLYMCMYILMVYLLAQNCFKFIDVMPGSFMKWISSGVKSFAEDASKKDAAAGKFSQSAFVAIEEPSKQMINQIDERVGEGAHAVGLNTDEEGIKKSVQNLFGKSKADRVTDVLKEGKKDDGKGGIKDLATRSGQAAKEAQGAKKKLDSAKTSEERTKLEEFIKGQEALRQANDPVLLYRELINPGNSGMSPAARAIARDNIEEMRTIMREHGPLIEEMLQDSYMKSGGTYLAREEIQQRIIQLISSISQNLGKKGG